MNFSITSEDMMLQDAVKGFVDGKVDSLWKVIDKEDRLPQEILDGVGELGLFGMSIPEEYGGLGLNTFQRALVHEALGRGPWGLASLMSVHTGIGCVGIVKFGNKQQKEHYLPKMATGEWIGSFGLTEPDAGSDAAAMKTFAAKKGDRYILNGVKTFITNAPRAHHVVVFTKTDKGYGAFIVDTDFKGFKIGSVFETIGHQGGEVSEVLLEDCEVPAENLLGEDGKGFEYAKASLTTGRTLLGTRSTGGAQKALEVSLAYANERKTFGQPLSEHQTIAFWLAQMSVRTEAARMLCYRSAWLIDNGYSAVRESSSAKLAGSETMWYNAEKGMQIFGGYGYIRGEYMIERIWRDARVARVYDGSSEIQQIVISRQLRKGDTQTPLKV